MRRRLYVVWYAALTERLRYRLFERQLTFRSPGCLKGRLTELGAYNGVLTALLIMLQ
jgi:hypothetical protein